MAITGQAFTLDAFLDLPEEACARIRRGGGETKSVAGDYSRLAARGAVRVDQSVRLAAKAGDGLG